MPAEPLRGSARPQSPQELLAATSSPTCSVTTIICRRCTSALTSARVRPTPSPAGRSASRSMVAIRWQADPSSVETSIWIRTSSLPRQQVGSPSCQRRRGGQPPKMATLYCASIQYLVRNLQKKLTLSYDKCRHKLQDG